MVRRALLVTLIVAAASVWSANALAATAPSAPVLMTAPYVSPALLQWTPGADPLNVSQSVYRAPGACTDPLTPGIAVMVYPDNTTFQHYAVPGDGTFCFFVAAADALGGVAFSPGLTVAIDTTDPIATVTVAGQTPEHVVSGTVRVTRTGTDAGSGVATTALRVGAVGACATGSTLRPNWNTTLYTDGAYDVCNVVTDRAGRVAIAVVTVTVSNPTPVPAPIPSPVPEPPVAAPAPVDTGALSAAPAGSTTTDKVAPGAPTKLSVIRPRARDGADLVPVTLRWVNPAASDLARVVVVLNAKRAPRGKADGKIVYSGLRTSAAFKLRAGASAYLALFALDRSGNVSSPARRDVSLAALIPLRPLTGSVVDAAPRLTWKAKDGTAYYNIQVFRNGRRVLVRWPAQSSFRMPAELMAPGIYTWFVWPAVEHKGSAPTFGDLIGRATFVYKR